MNPCINACFVPSLTSEERPSVSMGRLSPLATVSGKGSFLSSTSNPCLTGGDAHLRASFHSDRFPITSSQSTIRSKPQFFSDQGHGSIQHVQHEGMICSNKGCHRQIETGPVFREGEINLFCSNHQSSDVIATRTTHCQFTGCFNTPKYGQRKGPLKFCLKHKRVGMFTNINGQLLLATRDGIAFKDDNETEAVSAATSMNNFTVRDEILYNTPDGLGWRGGQPNSRENKSSQPSSNIGLQGLVMPASLGLFCAQDKFTSSAVGVMTTSPSKYRKMGEVQDSRIQPSYGPSGMGRGRFYSTHKKEGMVGLKNRPCIFPGCTSRPQYGLMGCHPIYCAKHKEPNMVHLLTEATNWEMMGVTRDHMETIKTTPGPICLDSKRLLSAICSKEGQLSRKVHKKNAPTYPVEDDEELDSRNGTDGTSLLPLPRLLQQQRGGKKETGKDGISGRRKIMSSKPTASPSLKSTDTSTSSNQRKALAASTEVVTPIEARAIGAGGNTSNASSSLLRKTENSSLAEVLDSKTSFEVQALKDVKEPAQADAPRGSERRARAPSRKALEASGKPANEGIQWLTKERKEAEARRIKEFRAQRKAAAAAGLRVGQVLEAAIIGPTFGADRANCGKDVSKPDLTKMTWRKLSPAETLQVAARNFTTNDIGPAHLGGGGEVVSGEVKANGDKLKLGGKDATAGISERKKMETLRTPQGTTRVVTLTSGTPFPPYAMYRAECCGNQSTQSRQVIPSPDIHETRRFSAWGSIDIHTITAGAGEVNGMKVCQFEDCSKRARFGINGIVRYCKVHALFGMHQIDVPA